MWQKRKNYQRLPRKHKNRKLVEDQPRRPNIQLPGIPKRQKREAEGKKLLKKY